MGAREHRPRAPRRDHAPDRRRRRRQGARSVGAGQRRPRRGAAPADARDATARSCSSTIPACGSAPTPENVHQHRVAARRSRTFLRATRAYVDPNWRRSVTQPLRELGEATGPVRDLDVLLEHLDPDLKELDEADRDGAASLMASLVARAGRGPAAAARGARRGARITSCSRASISRPAFARRRVDPVHRIARREFRGLAKAVKRLGKQPADAATARRSASRSSARATPPSCPLRRARPARRSSRQPRHCSSCSASIRTPPSPSRSSARRPSSTSRPPRRSSPAGSPSGKSHAGRALKEQIPAAWRRLRKRGAHL